MSQSPSAPPSQTGTSLVAEDRTEFGKGAARRVRRAHKIPAVLYGHGTAPRHLALPGHATMLALKQANALLSLQLTGGDTSLAIVKDVQVDVVRREIEHLDLVIVRAGERVEVNVPVHVSGEAAPETVVQVEQNALAVTALATALPEIITVDVEGAEAGSHVTAADVALPDGVELAADPASIVVTVSAAPSAAALEAELAEAEAELGIEHDAPADADETAEADAPEGEPAGA